METPGNILRSERERQNKSVNGIADSLRIKAEYLEAIEENRFHLLPAEVYAKAYLRLYAETLGLEGGDILRLYRSQVEADSDKGQETAREEKAFNYKPVLIIASILIVMITAVILSGNNKQTHVVDVETRTETAVSEAEPPAARTSDVRAETAPAAEIRDTAVEPAPAAAETGDFADKTAPAEEIRDMDVEPAPAAAETGDLAVKTASVETEIGSAPVETTPAAVETRDAAVETAPAAAVNVEAETALHADKTGEPDNLYSANDKKLSLRITATELTWISMRIDGDKRKEWSMRSGDEVTVAASDRFEIKVGNAGGTRLHLNNKDLGELGPHGKIIDIVLP